MYSNTSLSSSSPRNDIGRIRGLGEVRVSNIVDDWKQSLGYPDVQNPRELGLI